MNRSTLSRLLSKFVEADPLYAVVLIDKAGEMQITAILPADRARSLSDAWNERTEKHGKIAEARLLDLSRVAIAEEATDLTAQPTEPTAEVEAEEEADESDSLQFVMVAVPTPNVTPELQERVQAYDDLYQWAGTFGHLNGFDAYNEKAMEALANIADCVAVLSKPLTVEAGKAGAA